MGAHQITTLELIFFLEFTGAKCHFLYLKVYSSKLEAPHGANIFVVE
jgi:hypothetical protein